MFYRREASHFACLVILLGIYLLFSSPQTLFAQQRDFGMWHGIGLSREINDKVTFALDEQARLVDNALQIKSVFSNFSIAYQGRLNIKYIFHYRLTIGANKNKHRLATDFTYKLKRENINTNFNFRLRYLIDSSPQDRGEPADHYFRTKVSAKYREDFFGFTPYASLEFFFRLNQVERETDKFRMGIGAEYELTKRNSLKIAYLFQKEQNVPDRKNIHILYLVLDVDLTPKKEKKTKVDN